MKSTLAAKLVLISASLMLTGCVTMGTNLGAISGAPFCAVAEPIRYSKTDTEVTKKQVRELNAIGKRLCGWTGKTP